MIELKRRNGDGMRGVVDRVERHKNQMEVGVLDVKRRIQLGCVERRRYQMGKNWSTLKLTRHDPPLATRAAANFKISAEV